MASVSASGIRPVFAALGAVVLLMAISFTSSAHAADFTVTTTTDGEGPGTLRTALNDALESEGGKDRILFQGGLSGAINLNSNLPGLSGPLEIQGPGMDKLAIDGGDAHTIFAGIGDVTISGLTLRNGRGPAGGAVGLGSGTSVLDGVSVESSSADAGGGVLISGGSLSIKGSRLVDNSAPNGGGFIADAADVTISDTVVSGNRSNLGAGGAFSGTDQYSLKIENSRFADNTASQGGGGLAILVPTVGEVVSTKVEILGSEFTANSTTAGLAQAGLGGGAIFSGSSDLTIDASLFEGNVSATAAGGVYLSAPLPANKASIRNSTFVGNTAELAGGAIISQTLGLNVDSSTIVGNKVNDPFAPEYGGAGLLAVYAPGLVRNSIVSGNIPEDLSSVRQSDQYDGSIAGSFNLIGTMPRATYSETVPGSDIASGDPRLGPLADNGGPTRTMLPAADSPVVNKGLSYLETDQRGLLRPVKFGTIPFSQADQANGADIGSVELQSNRILFGKVKLKKKRGIAILPVTVPSGGRIALKGSRSVKAVSKTPKQSATLAFKVNAKGKALKKLRKVGTVKVKLTFTFSPTGGVASTKKKTIRLAMKKRHR